jgi:hypothetical protein
MSGIRCSAVVRIGDAQQRIAVGRGLGHRIHADAAVGARAVVDHDALRQCVGQRVADGAQHHVDDAACG